jgi:hypothetical protein
MGSATKGQAKALTYKKRSAKKMHLKLGQRFCHIPRWTI